MTLPNHVSLVLLGAAISVHICMSLAMRGQSLPPRREFQGYGFYLKYPSSWTVRKGKNAGEWELVTPGGAPSITVVHQRLPPQSSSIAAHDKYVAANTPLGMSASPAREQKQATGVTYITELTNPKRISEARFIASRFANGHLLVFAYAGSGQAAAAAVLSSTVIGDVPSSLLGTWSEDGGALTLRPDGKDALLAFL